jgi:hypothetical protein
MQYYPGAGVLRSDGSLPGTSQFRFDLTEEQRRLCDWVAQQARTGSRHIRYREATAALDIHDEQLTRMLRDMRERLDEIHEMVEAPIVNTQTPYFEVPVQARHIWENYQRAEQEVESNSQAGSRELELVQS